MMSKQGEHPSARKSVLKPPIAGQAIKEIEY